MSLSKTTQDHEEIKTWAEKHGAIPAEVASTETSDGPGILRFMFPKAKNHNDGALKEIAWEDFFEKFDANGLELLYQDKTAEGAASNFNKLIYPEHESSSASRKPSKSASSTAKKQTHATKKAS
jgi:hypothetical protein